MIDGPLVLPLTTVGMMRRIGDAQTFDPVNAKLRIDDAHRVDAISQVPA